MALELLTISAEEYAKSQGKKLEDYEIEQITYEGFSERMAEFSILVQADKHKCDVVVGFKYDLGSETKKYGASGIGLKLKKARDYISSATSIPSR